MTKDPYFTEQLTRPEHEAIKAVAHCEASAEQQQRALAVIVDKLCRRQAIPYVEGDFAHTAYLCGRMYVGELIARFVTAPVTSEDERRI